MANEFHAPDEGTREEDQKQIDESQSSGRIDWDARKWKPQSGEENLIRVLPAIGKASYHLKFGKHFIYHGEKDVEAFVCDLEVYGKPCPACEHFNKLMAEAVTDEDKKRAKKDFRVQGRGAFNVIDRIEEEKLKKEGEEVSVKLWEAPPVAVWEYIVGTVGGISKFNNIAGTYEDKERKIEADPLKGRDLVIFFKPKADPSRKYSIMPDETSSLGAKKQVAKWLGEATELLPENLYPETGYDTAHIKTFGTIEQRKELKEKLKEQYQKAQAPKEEKKEEPKKEEKVKDESDEVAELKKRLAEAETKAKEKKEVEAEKEKPKEEPKEETPDEDDEIAEAEALLAKAKARKEAKEKEKAGEVKEEEAKEEKKKSDDKTPEDVAARVKRIQTKHAKENE